MVKKVPLLCGKTVYSVFFENSMRTRTTFELATQRPSVGVTSLSVSTSSTSEGETLTDTLRNLEAAAADVFVMRHSDSGAAHFIAERISPSVAVVSGGDDRCAHPTQGMFGMLTIRRHKGDFERPSAATVGNILHSWIARLSILALKTLGCPDIHMAAPCTLLPIKLEERYGVRMFTNADEGLEDIGVVIMLRLQRERVQNGLLPSEGGLFKFYGLTRERLGLAKSDVIVIHPGPINRSVEIGSAMTGGARSVILDQVIYSVTIRVAALSVAIGGQSAQYQLGQEGAE